MSPYANRISLLSLYLKQYSQDALDYKNHSHIVPNRRGIESWVVCASIARLLISQCKSSARFIYKRERVFSSFPNLPFIGRRRTQHAGSDSDWLTRLKSRIRLNSCWIEKQQAAGVKEHNTHTHHLTAFSTSSSSSIGFGLHYKNSNCSEDVLQYHDEGKLLCSPLPMFQRGSTNFSRELFPFRFASSASSSKVIVYIRNALL